MNLFRSSFALVTAGALLLGVFAGCDSAGSGPIADGGIRGTGSSVGPVSGFGSVFVNGVEFFTDRILNQKVISNDGVESESDLEKGMILRINGEWQKDGTGHAESMEYDDSLRGTISNLSASAADRRLEFTIHNKPVFADTQTVLQGKSFADFANGDYVRISAWRQADGKYRASYIGILPADYAEQLKTTCAVGGQNDCYPIEVEGPVDKGSLTGTQFTMNALTVNFSGAEFTGGLSAETLEQGAVYEVEGELIGGVLHAGRIQKNDFRRYQRGGDDIELAGPVSSDYDSSSKSFGLNGLTIRITKDTDMEGLTLNDLKAGLLVQVEGEFVSEAVVEASEIEVREGDAEIEGTVDGQCPAFQNCLTVGGVRIQVTSRTIITDDENDKRLTIADLLYYSPASKFVLVEVSGLERKDEFGQVYVEALQIEREISDDQEDEYEIEGRLSSVTGEYIKMLGVKINTSGASFKKTSLNDLQSRLAEGKKVVLEVEYKKVPAGSGYNATEIESGD
ncbi:MAG TPA: DUF5666 domain-containing protein [Marinobacter sp.]|nr:DUF5666 domain-containing protein [Marinobacter sp.]